MRLFGPGVPLLKTHLARAVEGIQSVLHVTHTDGVAVLRGIRGDDDPVPFEPKDLVAVALCDRE
jgi:hypothetical protein